MTHHPKERPDSMSRRIFLLRSAGIAVAFSAAGPLLAACGNTTSVQQSTARRRPGPGGLPLARPDKRVVLPRWEDPIESGLQPEKGGTFTVFNYPYYFYKKLLNGVRGQVRRRRPVTPFDNVNSGLQRLASGAVTPDVMDITPDMLDIGVAGKLIKPLNLDYIPNLKKNIWPELVDPFYDGESRYTVPYTSTPPASPGGRTRSKRTSPAWTSHGTSSGSLRRTRARWGLLSENRETIGMALLRKGNTDINTEDPTLVNGAVSDLKQLYGVCNVKVDDLQYQTIPEGSSWLHQAWSGDMIAGYIYYLPKGTPASALAFWKAPKGKVPVQNDCFAVCSTTKKPVLSHLFLNYLLDNGVAYENFVDFNGYQPPLNEIDPGTLVQKGVVPENLANSVLTNDDLGPDSLQYGTLTSQGTAALAERLLELPRRRGELTGPERER